MCSETNQKEDQKETNNERPPEVEAPDLVPVFEGYSRDKQPTKKNDS